MGEYAEMMLDGTCCSQCGQFMDIDGLVDGSFQAEGFPGLCADCKCEERREARIPRFNKHSIKPNQPKANEIACPKCKRVVRKVGFVDHCRDVHSIDAHDLLIKELTCPSIS